MHLEVIRLFLKNLNVVSRTETGSSFQPIVVFNDIFEVSVGKRLHGQQKLHHAARNSNALAYA